MKPEYIFLVEKGQAERPSLRPYLRRIYHRQDPKGLPVCGQGGTFRQRSSLWCEFHGFRKCDTCP